MSNKSIKKFKEYSGKFALFAVLVGGLSTSASAAVTGNDAVTIGDVGSLLIGPYFTVNGGKTTSIGITNTADRAVAAKIRFRDVKKSRDIFDMVVILSRYDQLTGYLKLDPDTGRPVFNVSRNVVDNGLGTQDATPTDIDEIDDTCRVPAFGDLGTGSYLFREIPGVSNAELREGHVEVIAMSLLDSAAPGNTPMIGDFATHQHSAMNCNFFEAMFGSRASLDAVINSPLGQGIIQAPVDVLRGTFAINQNADGYQAAGEMMAISGFNPNGGADSLFAHSIDPVAAIFNDGSDNTEEAHPHIKDYTGYAGIDTVLGDPMVANDWSVNVANDVALEWVLNFPTKYAHVADYDVLGVKDLAALAPWTQSGGNYCLLNRTVGVWDREEKKAGLTVSPGERLHLCDETQVLQWIPVGMTAPEVLTSSFRKTVNISGLDNPFGWARINLTDALQEERPVAQVGFAINTRKVDASSGARQGSLVPHTRLRQQIDPVPQITTF